MKRTLYAVYEEPALASRAKRALRRAGFSDDDLSLFSSEPYEDPDLDGHAERSHIPRMALAGGALGALSGCLLAIYTFKAMMLPTGHMPIITLAPAGIVTFALGGLGAVVGTLLGLIREAKLLDFSSPLKDEELLGDLAKGCLLLAVRCQTDELAAKAETMLCESGALKIKSISL